MACILAGLVTLGVAACGGTSKSQRSTGKSTERTLNVSLEDYMPYIGVSKSGKITGLDGDIMTAIANKLGYKIRPSVTDFSGTLAAVQSGRADVTLGSIAWSTDRAKSGLFTDPVYYSHPVLIQKTNTSYSTIAELKGRSIASQPADVIIPALKAAGAQVKTYTNNADEYQDLSIGRVAGVTADPLVAEYAVKQNPNFHFHSVFISAPSPQQLAQHPEFAPYTGYQVAFYLSKKNSALEKKMNQVIRSMYSSGELDTILKKWNAPPKQFLTPLPVYSSQRVGVDRPKGWTVPR